MTELCSRELDSATSTSTWDGPALTYLRPDHPWGAWPSLRWPSLALAPCCAEVDGLSAARDADPEPELVGSLAVCGRRSPLRQT
jgi:hypothetical protein